MKKFSKKGVLLFAAAMALCAFVMPSMASASSWGVVGTHHTLTSPDIGFINDAGGVSSMCTSASFTSNVVSTAVVEITGGTFSGCAAAGAIGTCTATSSGTNFPWTATARTTSDIQIHGVNINVVLEGAACGVGAATPLRITGTLSGARWNGNGANQHEALLIPGVGGATGLVGHSAFGGNNAPLTLTGTIRDAQQTLTVTN